MRYELLLTDTGQCLLTLDGETMWSSDGDDDFTEEFGQLIESNELNDVAAWLVSEGYIPPRVEIDVVDESIEPGEESGWFETLDDPDDDDEDEDDDTEEGDA